MTITDEEINKIYEWADKFNIMNGRKQGGDETDIKGIPRKKEKLLKIVRLNLSTHSSDNITYLPSELFKLPYLKTLDIMGTNIIQLPKEISSLVGLSLKSEVFINNVNLLTNLQRLHLDGGEINDDEQIFIPSQLWSFKDLTFLRLEGFTDTKLSKTIGLFLKLKTLIIEMRNLIEIPKEIGKLDALEYLDLSDSYDIKYLPIELKSLNNLEDLNLEYTKISKEEIGKFASCFPKLTGLNGNPYFQTQIDKPREGIKSLHNKLMATYSKGTNTIYYGVAGVGKTYKMEELKQDFDHSVMITFHQSYGYEEFMEGLRASSNEGSISYDVRDGIFKKLCNEAKDNPQKSYAIFIDEINRGNISKIFGEFITLIEVSKRDKIEIELPYSGELFTVPFNVSIIGTMNTADRSITPIDTALRRRFNFIEIVPNSSLLSKDIEGINLQEMLKAMNARIEYLYDREHIIGHAYLIEVKNFKQLQKAMQENIIPLLAEYFYEDWENIRLVLNNNFIEKDNKDEKYTKHLNIEERSTSHYTFCPENMTKEAFVKIYSEG